jgi:hypothetical protein
MGANTTSWAFWGSAMRIQGDDTTYMKNIPFRICSIVQILHVVNCSCLKFCIFHYVLAFSYDIIGLGHYYGTFVVFLGCQGRVPRVGSFPK